MRLIVAEDYDGLSREGADLVASVIFSIPDATAVLATGETPVGLYRELQSRRKDGTIDLSRLRVFQLDEYLGLDPKDPRLLYDWMKQEFIGPLGVPEANVMRLSSDPSDPEDTCREYEAAISSAGGFDLAILGLGPNGHLGFNEPPTAPDSPTRIVNLSGESIESNARYWGGYEQVPRRALTVGMKQLLAAKHIFLIVSGRRKHDVVHQLVNGPVTPNLPASYLQAKTNVTILVDRAAWQPESQASHDSLTTQ